MTWINAMTANKLFIPLYTEKKSIVNLRAVLIIQHVFERNKKQQ